MTSWTHSVPTYQVIEKSVVCNSPLVPKAEWRAVAFHLKLLTWLKKEPTQFHRRWKKRKRVLKSPPKTISETKYQSKMLKINFNMKANKSTENYDKFKLNN
jgi:hypothetical protein